RRNRRLEIHVVKLLQGGESSQGQEVLAVTSQRALVVRRRGRVRSRELLQHRQLEKEQRPLSGLSQGLLPLPRLHLGRARAHATEQLLQGSEGSRAHFAEPRAGRGLEQGIERLLRAQRAQLLGGLPTVARIGGRECTDQFVGRASERVRVQLLG